MDGYQFWENKLNKAQYAVAPMVDQSELPWRLLSRKYGAQLCYTPMLHASVFVKDARYRKDNLASCAEDRPLIIQFCANDPDVLYEAAKLCQGHCEGIDLNLGCPQAIARRGHYGAYLQDDWDLIFKIVNKIHTELDIPITCKIRIFPEVEKTIRYAQMIESAGCMVLTVHGRLREQKGPFTGLADWKTIKAVKQSVKIPVFANGNIQYFKDIHECLKETGVDGVMTAEGNLHNPCLFMDRDTITWEVAEEYLILAKKYPCPFSYIRGHLFKIFHHCLTLESTQDLRDQLAKANTMEQFEQFVHDIKELFLNFKQDWKTLCPSLPFPPWICQPYERPSPKTECTTSGEKNIIYSPKKRQFTQDELDLGLSKKKMKKLLKYPKKNFTSDRILLKSCSNCPNPKGLKCDYEMCKSCCRNKTFTSNGSCSGKLSSVIIN
ncbi:tRNA-dihydrouridine(16/17) synthase [NAD(P)(+)]-like [Nymphon striatum]|nr:tRNA-dihydrouridine(16/17) synthase [NAD(P)(+)]-like [Nymphon striatum]